MLVAALFSFPASAHHTCAEGYELQFHAGLSGNVHDSSSGEGACSAWTGSLTCGPAGYHCRHLVTGTFTHTNYQNCLFQHAPDGTNTWSTTTQSAISATCIPVQQQDPCSALAGTTFEGDFTSGGTASTVCGDAGGGVMCEFTLHGVGVQTGTRARAGYSYFGAWTNGGTSCENGGDGTAGTQSGSNNCITDGADTTCHATNQTNCGTFNGQPICVESVPAGTCMFLGDGGVACDPNAGTPPIPDTGTPGVEADPDGVIDSGTGNGGNGSSINYYNSGTVAGSSNVQGPPGDYQPPEDGDNCTPGTDCPAEWVDRQYDPGTPGQFTPFQVNPGELQNALDDAMPTVDYSTEGDSWSAFFRGTFPFSLIAGPLTSLAGDDAAPVFDWQHGSETTHLDLSMWNDVAGIVRLSLSLLMVWGFWWFTVETLWRAL